MGVVCVIRRGPLWLKIERAAAIKQLPFYPPVVVRENPLVVNYRESLPDKLLRCKTVFGAVSIAVCHEFGLTRAELVGDGTKRKYALPRQIAMHLMTKEFARSNRMVAALFNRDHTCVRFANEKIPKLANESDAFARRLRNLTVAVRAAA